MYKNLLTVLIIGTISSAADAAEIYNKDGNKLDLYGQVAARHYFSGNKAVDGDATFIRFGFKGETQINDILTGFGQWEYNVQGNNSEGTDATRGTKTRLGFAGLKVEDLGSLDYGRNYGIIYDVAAITDTPVIFDDETFSSTDNFMTGRANGLLTYRNHDFFGQLPGLNFGLQYQGANDESQNNSRSPFNSNGDGYGFSVEYDTAANLSILGAYSNSKRTDQQNKLSLGEGERAEIWATGLKYDDNNLYLAATYAEAHNLSRVTNWGFANKTQNIELVAQYTFGSGITPQIGYFKSKAKNLEGHSDQDILNYWDFSLSYAVNKNMSVYVDYKLNKIKSDNSLSISSDDQTGAGLTYHF